VSLLTAQCVYVRRLCFVCTGFAISAPESSCRWAGWLASRTLPTTAEMPLNTQGLKVFHFSGKILVLT
jgi:hypothetical protein